MKYCFNCGNPVEENAKFCVECGVKLALAYEDEKNSADRSANEEVREAECIQKEKEAREEREAERIRTEMREAARLERLEETQREKTFRENQNRIRLESMSDVEILARLQGKRIISEEEKREQEIIKEEKRIKLAWILSTLAVITICVSIILIIKYNRHEDSEETTSGQTLSRQESQGIGSYSCYFMLLNKDGDIIATEDNISKIEYYDHEGKDSEGKELTGLYNIIITFESNGRDLFSKEGFENHVGYSAVVDGITCNSFTNNENALARDTNGEVLYLKVRFSTNDEGQFVYFKNKMKY